MPGGGFGIFNGCTPEWGTPAGGWGNQYGGVTSRSQCDSFPAALQQGCYWRFDWFQNADNPTVTFQQVECPAALTAKTGCVRADDSIPETPTGSSVVPTWTGSVPGSGSGTSSWVRRHRLEDLAAKCRSMDSVVERDGLVELSARLAALAPTRAHIIPSACEMST